MCFLLVRRIVSKKQIFLIFCEQFKQKTLKLKQKPFFLFVHFSFQSIFITFSKKLTLLALNLQLKIDQKQMYSNSRKTEFLQFN